MREDLNENPEIKENCYAFMRNIRGTAAYWQRAKLDLFAMFRTLGPPSYFITLSADDMNWPDLMYVLAKRDGQNLTDEQVLEMTKSERVRLLCAYPVIVAQHFNHRFHSFLNYILKGNGNPIGEVVDYFWRVEFQQRGSPHVHSLWWVKGTPNLQTVEGKRKAATFIDKYITCAVPNAGEDDELRSLVLRLQKHSHTHTCRKDGRYRCRFDYPKNASDTTHLKRNIDVGNKARFYVLRRAQGAEMINPYNPSLLRAWGANMDIQMVGSVYGAAEYVCHYMCKDEPQQLRQLIATNLDKLPQNSTQRQRLLKIGNTLISHRILSAQEAVYRTTGLHLRGSTRVKILKSTHQLRELDESDTNVFQTGLFERYASRPSGDPFDTMSLSHWYGISKTSVNEATSSRAQPRYQLQNNMGCIYLRRKQACLHVPTVTPESHGDDYYYHLLLLYLPWRNETGDLLGDHSTAMESFVANKDQLQVLNAEHASFADEVQRATQQLRAINQFGDNIYVPIAPSTAQVNLQLNEECAGLDPAYNQELYLDPELVNAVSNQIGDGGVANNGHINDHNNDHIGDFHDDVTANCRRRFTDAEFEERVSSLRELLIR